MKFEHPLAKYRSTLSVDILGRSTCRPTLSWPTVKMSLDMLVNMLANMSTEGQWTFSQYFDDTWLTLLLELHFLHVSSNFCRFHWQGIDLSNVKKLSAQFFLQTFLRTSCMLHKKICTLTWLRRHRVREDMNSDLWSDFLSGWLCWTFSDLLSVLTF